MEKEHCPHPPVLSGDNLGLFLQTAEASRLDGRETAECLALWEEWRARLSCVAVTAGGRAFLAVWLDGRVDNAVDAAWRQSPSRGFLLNALAQTLCMCAVRDRIPEISTTGCAPVPAPTPELAQALTAAGLPARAGSGLTFSLRYVVVTPFPFSSGCDACALAPSCPRPGK